MAKTAVVTGAGSGVGQAIALRLAAEGWQVALVGRRAETLADTIRRNPEPNLLRPYECDVADPDAVAAMATQVQADLGVVELLVNAAGTNAPQRSLATISRATYDEIVDSNLNGAFYCTQAFLPAMRDHQSGTVINIVSVAGLQASPKAGVAYVVSKFGMAGLTQAINAEENPNGIRACAIFPGDINTPILDKRPNPPSLEARRTMLQPDDVAECAMLAVNLPAHVVIDQLVVRPRV